MAYIEEDPVFKAREGGNVFSKVVFSNKQDCSPSKPYRHVSAKIQACSFSTWSVCLNFLTITAEVP